MYNYTYEKIIYPKCEKTTLVEFQMYFGYLDVINYKIGDEIDFRYTHFTPEGIQFGEAYTVCQKCDTGFHAQAVLNDGKLEEFKLIKEHEGVEYPYMGDLPRFPEKN